MFDELCQIVEETIYQATQFRIWATRTLREFILTGGNVEPALLASWLVPPG